MAGMRRDAGSGSLYQRADGMWIGSVTLPERDGKRRRKNVSSKTKSGAQKKLQQLRKQLDATGDIETRIPTVGDWMEQWLNLRRKDLKPSVWPSYVGKTNKYIIPAIGKKKLDQLRPSHIRDLEKYIVEELGLSTTTALTTHAILSKALTDAKRERLIQENVAQLVGRPKKAISKRGALTTVEARALLTSVAGDPEKALKWSVALLLGLRQGERLGLTRGAIDLDTGTLTIIWQLQRIAYQHGCEPHCGNKRAASCPNRLVDIPAHMESRHMHGNLYLLRPKSKAGWRELPLPAFLVEMFKVYFEGKVLLGEDLVFTRNGSAWDPKVDNTLWLQALEEAGLPRVTLHEARHTTATLLHELGVPEMTRVAILGHSEATVTAGYTHITDSVARAAIDSLGEAIKPLMLEG